MKERGSFGLATLLTPRKGRFPVLVAVLACAAVMLVLYTLLVPSTVEGSSNLELLGSATLSPDQVRVTDWASIQLVYQVGPDGIQEGGGIQVQFPKSWHPWGATSTAPQTTDPTANYYVTAETSRPEIDVAIGIANVAIDGRTDRMDWTSTLTVSGGSLVAGDTITYTLGDQTYGGMGFQAGAAALVEIVRVAADTEADGIFLEIPNPPSLTTVADVPYRLAVHVPSQTRPGTPFRLVVTAQDRFTNVAGTFSGTVTFSATDTRAELPSPYSFTPADGGTRSFTVTLHTTGTHWISVMDAHVAPGGQTSNPTICATETPALGLYWGDLHSHTGFSKDGVGPLSQALVRMRDQLAADFYAVTDHMDYPDTGLTVEEWQATRDLVQEYHLPGTFVPILAYEWSSAAPYGHHNVYFEGADGPLCYLDACDTLQALWDALAGEAALTLPHHTGIRWGQSEHTVDWTYNDARFRTSIEIYSVHGQSELYDPTHPLSYEMRRPGIAESVDGPHYARDAWAAGHQVGVVAGSDNHDVKPGMPWNGLTAVYASSLTRAGLFEAIRSRHTYATTGERILLEFRLGNAMMGDVVQVHRSSPPTFDVRVVGTAALDWVELVRFDGHAYTVVYAGSPGAGSDPREMAFSFTDTTNPGDRLYYVRAQQPDPNKPERIAMAWSSPIWTERGPTLYLPWVQQNEGSP